MRRGWDVDALLAAAGIAPDLLAEGRSRVTAAQLASVIRALWRATDDELLGFGLAPVPRGTAHLLAHAMITAPDLGGMLRRCQGFRRAVPGFPPPELTTDGERARFTCDVQAVEDPVPLLVDTMLAVVHRFLGWAIGKRLPLHVVEVPYRRQPEIDDHDLIFGAPMAFGADRPGLVFATRWLAAPIVRGADELDGYLRDSPARFLTDGGYSTTLTGQVRARMARGLGGAWPGVEEIAAGLAMSPQTLRRRLREEGTSAREIREQILRDAAIAGLVRGQETVQALSRRLGFSEPSTFSRAFRRWTGSPPGAYQRRNA
nr:AraC family transcriptional regulator [Amycolatopsis lexingtonensis]